MSWIMIHSATVGGVNAWRAYCLKSKKKTETRRHSVQVSATDVGRAGGAGSAAGDRELERVFDFILEEVRCTTEQENDEDVYSRDGNRRAMREV